MRTFLRTLVLFVVTAISIVAMHHTQSPLPVHPPRTGPAISDARTWGYQLQRPRPGLIDPAIDLLVVDYSRDGRHDNRFTAADVDAFRARPDGKKRIVLAYMSVGEAETYRFYWGRFWAAGSNPITPRWLGSENPDWRGNYKVRFWDTDWQELILHSDRSLLDRALERILPQRKAYLDHIIDAGFDGVYLDRVDAFDEWSKERPSAEADMVALVSAISAHAKTRRPGFLIVPQNGEELMRNAVYRRAIDALAKEDLFFGLDRTDEVNNAQDINRSVLLLKRATAQNQPVFVVEYIAEPSKQSAAMSRARQLGFNITFASRALDRPPVAYFPDTDPPPVAAK